MVRRIWERLTAISSKLNDRVDVPLTLICDARSGLPEVNGNETGSCFREKENEHCCFGG